MNGAGDDGRPGRSPGCYRILAFVSLLALIVRLLFVLITPEDRLMRAGWDQGLYDRLGVSISRGEGLSFSPEVARLKHRALENSENPLRHWVARPDLHFGLVESGVPTSVIPPLYPLFLGGVYTIAGHQHVVVRILQALLGALAVLCFTAAAGEWFRGDAAVMLGAGIFIALYPFLVFYSGLLTTENLYILFLAAAAWSLIRLSRPDRPVWIPTALLSGLFLGGAFLTRSSILLFLPLALAVLFILTPRRRAAAASLLLLLAFSITVSPWVARNYRVHGQFVLMPTKGGINLWMRNHPEVVRGEFLEAGLGFPDDLVPRLEKAELLQYPEMDGFTEVERNRFVARRALSFIAANPRYFAALSLRRFFWVMSVTGSSSGHWAHTLAGIGSYGLMLPFALAGMWLSWRRRDAGALVPALLVVYTIGLHTLFHGGVRYRLPVDPFLAIFAVSAAVSLWRRFPVRGTGGPAGETGGDARHDRGPASGAGG